ncbi:MAG TPA: zf-HC2 domain-containing protein [Streptosporangiaceae bacterium]|nr:zf-HC2 domain-containing protein [Streptosporangiaceae bacterium]
MTRHIGARTLARFHHADLSPRRSSRIRAHLAGCERCHALDEDLAGVTTMLAEAQPPPIPEHLTTRIQTALATEAARRAALTTGAPAASAEATGTKTGRAWAEPTGAAGPEVPEAPPGRRTPHHGRPGRARRRPRLPGFSSPIALRTMAAAAAAVVLAGGGYEVAQHVGGSSPSASQAGSAPHKATVMAPGAGAASGSRAAASQPANGPVLHYRHDGQEASVTPEKTTTDFTPANLRSQVSSDLSPPHSAFRAASPNARQNLPSPAGQPLTLGGIPVSTLQDCVNRIAAGQQVLLVEVARYQGTPATVIVTSAQAGSPELVWVVGTGCSGTSNDLLTHVTLAPVG